MKHTNMHVSDNFKSRAKNAKDHLFRRNKPIKEFMEYCDSKEKCCARRKLDVNVDSAQRTMIGALLEGELKMFADTAEVRNFKNLEMRKSGFEL